ncbi:TIGR02302 family protein [Azospirillum doebereinerae]|uniref:TIGR02302 family protein n=1 Tax=Azospirillum doebereinerae TaxID=92933 RepID=A0A3S1CGB6_9PROT|nr:TIGR02302 family protein [Azospirillum doebereinerae]MCG5243088.1 TIGR02302 family protein [Azospirillum doebereinerae]RUQ69314.1 TIGR02302 family protein [Azospirillum doebereinerae]
MKQDAQRPDPARTAPAGAPPSEPRARLWQARSALVWERLGPAVWAPLSILGVFAALALFNLLPHLPGWLHAAVLVLLVGAFLLAAIAGFRRLRLPDEAEARRRLERDSGLPHRPLNTLRDRSAGGDPMAEALWRLHQERTRAAMRRLRVAWPDSTVPSHDRFALRALVVLLIVVAGASGWGDWRPRLMAAVSPRFDGGAVAATATLDLWVTPPEYTGLPPVFLKAGNTVAAPTDQPIAVPKGSQVMARVSGGGGTPTLEAGERSAPFETVDPTTFQIQHPIEAGTRIAVTQGGRTLGSWPVRVVPDSAPIVAHANPPAAGERGALRLDYTARDDYGLTEVKAQVRPAAPSPAPGPNPAPAPLLAAALRDAPPLELPLALPGLRPKEARNSAFHDLTAHPWAGLPVTVRLIATDGAGQTGQSEDAAITLPERVFNHPVARAIVAQRKILTQRPVESRVDVARALAELSTRPGQFGQDLVVFLALRTSVARLMLDDSEASIPALQQLLWETALRIEDGGLSLAERDLRDAERRLSEALDKGATDAELNQLMDELQAALDKFMDAMEQRMMEALQRGEQIPTVPPEMADQMTDRNDLQQMMDRMREMAQTGSRDAARQMLSQMQQMLENMRSGAMAQQGQQGNQQNEAWQMMQELQKLGQQQQQLLDQSFRQSQDQMNQQGQQGQPGQQGPRGRQQPGQQGQQGRNSPGNMAGSPTLQKQAEQQEALRRQLGDLMRRMGEQSGGDIPRPLGRAERAMRDAAQALQQGSPGAAVPSQTQAMDELQQGMQSMAEQLAQQMMMGQGPAMMGQQGQQPGRQQGKGRDPLGRRPSGYGMQDSNDVKIPEQSELQRAREILDELRRRSGQYGRPQPEREYIDRLLKQF